MNQTIRTIGLLLNIFSILIITSCNSPKRLQHKLNKYCEFCPKEEARMVHDSFIYISDTIYREKIVEVPLPNDTVRIVEYIEADDDGVINMDAISYVNGMIEAIAWVKNNLLHCEAYIKDSTIFVKLDSLETVIKETKESYHSEDTVHTIVKTKNSSFANFTTWFFWIIVVISSIYIGFKYLRRKLF